jgi:hypothetical protein
MKILAALLLGYFVVIGQLGQILRPQAEMTKLAHSTLSAPVVKLLEKAASSELSIVPEPIAIDLALDKPVRVVTRRGRVLNLPLGCRTVSQPHDLLVHFHGAPTAVEPAFERSGIDGVLFIVNLGVGSGRYEQTFAAPGTFASFLESVQGHGEVSVSGCSVTREADSAQWMERWLWSNLAHLGAGVRGPQDRCGAAVGRTSRRLR